MREWSRYMFKAPQQKVGMHNSQIFSSKQIRVRPVLRENATAILLVHFTPPSLINPIDGAHSWMNLFLS